MIFLFFKNSFLLSILVCTILLSHSLVVDSASYSDSGRGAGFAQGTGSDIGGSWTVWGSDSTGYSFGNWTSGGGTYGSSGGNSSNAAAYNGPMCIVGGCVTCSRNVYEPCPVQTYSQSTYYTQAAYEDTPNIGGETTNPSVGLYIQKQGASGWSKNVQVTPSEEVSLRWVASNVTYCQSKDTTEFSLANTGGVSGTTDMVNEPETGVRTYAIECRNAAGTTVESLAALTILATPLEFTAVPNLVRTKETSELTWNVYGRTGCTIANKANGADSSTISTSAGSRDTVALSGETTYRLSCPDGATADTTIKVLPAISET